MYPDDGYNVNQQQESWRVDRTKVNPQNESKKHVRLQQKVIQKHCNLYTLFDTKNELVRNDHLTTLTIIFIIIIIIIS